MASLEHCLKLYGDLFTPEERGALRAESRALATKQKMPFKQAMTRIVETRKNEAQAEYDKIEKVIEKHLGITEEPSPKKETAESYGRKEEPTSKSTSLKEPEAKYATKPKHLTEKELLEKKRLFQEYGAKTKGDKVILYRGGDVPKSQLRNLRYGDYLSASGKGPDITGNEGADAYGKNVVRFELPIIDIEVTGAGEFQYKGKAASLKKGGRKYPVTIYKAYNDYYGSNFTAEEIDKEDDVRKVASMALPGGREEFDALMAEHQALKEPEAKYVAAENKTTLRKLKPSEIEAIQNTQGAVLDNKGLTLDVVRYQKKEQAGELSVRAGVFFLPEKNSPYKKYYTTGKLGYGGSERSEGRTTYRNPIMVKAASGGRAPKLAYDFINGKGAYEKMRSDVLDNAWSGNVFNRRPDEEGIYNLLEKYGGIPDLAWIIAEVSTKGNTLAYAIQEHIVASSVRKAGYDAVIGYNKIGGKLRLSEVFDVRPARYPSREAWEHYFEDFYDTEKAKPSTVIYESEPKYAVAESETDLAFGGKKKADEAIESVAKEIETVSVSRRGMPDRGRVAKPKIAKAFRAKRRVDLTGRKLAKGNEAQEIAELFQVYRSPKMEILHSIYTAEDGTILGHNALTSGEINVVAPKDVAKYVYKMKSAAKRLGAAKIHTHHNHPSGNPAMSQNDKVFAARLHAELGDLMGEFVVIDHGKFTWVSKYERIRRGESYVTVEEGTYKVLPGTGEWMLKKGPKLTGPDATAAFGDSLAYDKSKACFVYVDNGNNVVGWSTHDNTILKKSVPELEKILRQQAKAHNAIKTVIIAEDMALLEPIAEYGDAGDWLLDALDAKGESLRETVPMAFEVKRRPAKPARGLFESESGYGKEKVIAIPPLKGQVEKILQAEADIGEVEKPIIERKKPLLTKAQKRLREKKKAIKEKQIKIENAEEAKKQVHAMIRNRRQNLNLATYETNLFINDIEKQTTKEQREVLPFIIEKTDIPKSLGRHDLEKIYKENKKDLSLIATQIKKHFDDSWQKMKENIPDMSAEQIEDYVTHIWDLNKKQKRIVTNWFITQNRFLKKRYIKTLKEGIEDLGLTPKTLDVGEIIRIHDSVVNRTIENKKFVKELKKLKFEGVSLIERADKAPKDWVYFDHPALKQGLVIPGKLKVGEKVSPELSNLLADMGVAIGRRISPVAFGKTVKKTGEYKAGEPPEIRFQRFMSNRTIAHEIGHHLDNVLKLGKNFLNDYKSELYEINRERIEKFKGEKGKYNEAYARSAEEQIAEFFATLFTDASKAYKLAPNATADVLNRLKQDGTLSKLIDFDFEKQAKNLVEEQLNTMVKLPVKVHPDLEKPLKVIFDSRIEHPAIQAYEVVNGVLKKTNLSLSLFHHGALGETGIATTGLRKTLNIYFNPVKIYKAMLQNKFDVFEKEPIARRWIKAGLQVGATADIPVNMIQDKLNNLARKTKNIPLINKTTKFISTFNETWDKALWNYLHDTLKLYACESLGTKIDPLKDITKQEQEIAQFVNDAFGGQNWDTLMVSPKTLQVMSWSLLSPDWTTSTVRQALAPTGIGRVYKETSGLRRKSGIYFWIKAGLYFGLGINMLNYAFRMYDEKKHPEYYEGMGKRTFLDRTMAGNAIGNKTRLFVGRYKDGSERYLRWGKQFRELPELFFDDTGFCPISATLKKVGGKLAPIVQLTSKIFTGTSPSGFKDDDIYGKRGWDYAYGIGKVLIKSPFPFATRALFQEGKEFHITDIAMPSSKGMTRWKAIDLFKHAIIKKDERFLKEVYQYTLMNNLPAYTLFSTALTILKAENTKEFNEGIKTIEEAEKALDKISNPKDLLRAQNRLNRITKENIDRKIGIDLLDAAIIDMEKYNTENNINFK